MSGALVVEIESAPLEQLAADVAVAGFFQDERPLRGGAGRVDWRLAGLLSQLALGGRVRGAPGEGVLLPTAGRMRAPRVLLLGLGARDEFGAGELRSAVRDALTRVLELEASSAVLDLPGLHAGLAPEAASTALVRGASEALAEREASLLVRLAVAPGRARPLRAALERAARARRAGKLSIRPAALASHPASERSRSASGAGRRPSSVARQAGR